MILEIAVLMVAIGCAIYVYVTSSRMERVLLKLTEARKGIDDALESFEQTKKEVSEGHEAQKKFMLEQMMNGMSPHDVSVLRVPQQGKPINPELDRIEKELDALMERSDRGSDYERKEGELISKMVDIIIKEADKRLILQSHSSGST